jgi:hypothetical protein
MLLSALKVKDFLYPINNELSNNLTETARKSIAGLLALDYAGRLNSEPDIDEHASKCISNLKNFLKLKVVLDDSFASNMALFSIAISSAKNTDKDDDNLLSRIETNDLLVDTLVEMHFGHFSPEDKVKIRKILQRIIEGKDGEEILNFIAKEPKLIKGIIETALIKHKVQKEIEAHVSLEMHKILKQVKAVNTKISKLKQMASKIATAASVLAIATMGTLVPVVALPFIVVPAAITCVKYSADIGAKVGQKIAEANSAVKEGFKNIEKAKTEINAQLEMLKESKKEQSKDKDQSLAKTISKEILAQIDIKIPQVKLEKTQAISQGKNSDILQDRGQNPEKFASIVKRLSNQNERNKPNQRGK